MPAVDRAAPAALDLWASDGRQHPDPLYNGGPAAGRTKAPS
ncbi:hypothetical protein [Streptomyces kaempferi]|uniref:Uncharacterized protein n=1 Tax=Streptomyces kaempferi TaxID=333725 RepID=A0ABW3XV70_9ACTN